MLISGLFAGIGGFESGFRRAGHSTILLCENDPYAVTVLKHRFPSVRLHEDVADLEVLPENTDVVAAGFPCQNLSMAGDKAGIRGRKSSMVDHLFRLLDNRPVPWVVIENVYFMLHLGKGAAMESILGRLEERGYRWAYRVVDSRAFGLPQRRRRVFIIATQSEDPRRIILSDDAPRESWPVPDMDLPIGFYWTEGHTGSGLTGDAIPPLKAGSSLGIPCPPAVLLPSGRVVTPPIEAVERLQGFPPRWSSALRGRAARRRWRLLGNAVSVPVAAWIGHRLIEPGEYDSRQDAPLDKEKPWPKAAWNMGEERVSASVSELPVRRRRGRLSAFNTEQWPDLSVRALLGFVKRARRSKLKYPDGFREALEADLIQRGGPLDLGDNQD